MDSVNAPQSTKACEFCGEQILAVAKKCKHCGSMLDGSAPPLQGVVVKGIDAFAEYHTEIQGKKEGKLTVFGYLGMGLGLLFVFFSLSSKGAGGSGFGALMGIGFMIASYLWLRRK
jgi:hypothetical protein